jgi:hypothetical protein
MILIFYFFVFIVLFSACWMFFQCVVFPDPNKDRLLATYAPDQSERHILIGGELI